MNSGDAITTPATELSLVIPVYNGGRTVGGVVEEVAAAFAGTNFEVILVDDGSDDDSEAVCRDLTKRFAPRVTLVQLSRNFGEHSAVLAGLNFSRGRYVATLDDDGQNPPREVLRLLEELKRSDCDVVYGHYIEKQHSWFRNAGSRFNNRVATLMLKKPKELYLSSFKVMSRFVVEEIVKYGGPFPYTDGLIYRVTRKIRQIPVEHRADATGASRYTLRKLTGLWLSMFLNFSIVPLRMAVYVGLFTAALSVFALAFILVDKLWITPDVTVGIPSVLACMVLFSGVQLVVLGLIGEYLGRLYLGHTGTPQYVVREVTRAASTADFSDSRETDLLGEGRGVES